MATWRRPDLLLLDEHTAALDPQCADQIVRVTERIVSEHTEHADGDELHQQAATSAAS